MKDFYKNLSSCKRFDCKYHASIYSMNGCDYCFLTNIPRKSSVEVCNKYSPCSPEEKQKYREIQSALQTKIAELTYAALTQNKDYYKNI